MTTKEPTRYDGNVRHFEDRLSLLFRRQQEKTRSGRNKKKQTQQRAHDAPDEEELGSGGLVGNTAEGATTRMKSQDVLRNKNRRCEFYLKETLAQLQRQEVTRMQLIYERVADERDELQRIADCPSDRDPAAVKYLEQRENERTRRARLSGRHDPLAERLERVSAALQADRVRKKSVPLKVFPQELSREATASEVETSTRPLTGASDSLLTPTLPRIQAPQPPSLLKSHTMPPGGAGRNKGKSKGKAVHFGAGVDLPTIAHRWRKNAVAHRSHSHRRSPLPLRLNRFYERLEDFSKQSEASVVEASQSNGNDGAYEEDEDYAAAPQPEARAAGARPLEDPKLVCMAIGSLAIGGTHYVRRGSQTRAWFLARDRPPSQLVLQRASTVIHDLMGRLQLPPDAFGEKKPAARSAQSFT